MRNSSIDETWARLRATRSNPPPAAAVTPKRRETYVFALEQAEQMFHAASTVGPATRPLLIFYGLNQAGRAIAAAAATVDELNGWRLSGHGIKARELASPLPDVEVHSDGSAKGSFVRLSQILGSPLWDKTASVPLNQLWDTLPENRLWPLRDNGNRRTALYVDPQWFDGQHPLANAAVAYLPPQLIDSADPRRDFKEFMSAYPSAARYDFARVGIQPDAAPRFSRHVDGWGEINLSWRTPQGMTATQDDRDQHIRSITTPYGRRAYFLPTVGSNGTSLHPLMAWWTVLYALSMLARYQPAEWASHIDVDSSPYAVPIEQSLSAASGMIPDLVAQTIQQVSQA